MALKKLSIIFVVFILGTVLAQPTKQNEGQNNKAYKHEHCIKMTPKKEKDIQAMIQKIGEFLNELQEQQEDFDIRLVKFDVEQHSEDEVEEKDMVLQVTVNDCANIEEDEEEIKVEKETKQVTEVKGGEKKADKENEKNPEKETDKKPYKENGKNLDKENEQKPDKENENKPDKATEKKPDKENDKKPDIENNKGNSTQVVQETEIDFKYNEKTAKQPTIFNLKLEENGQILIDQIEKKIGKNTPLLVYMQETDCRQDFVFLNTK